MSKTQKSNTRSPIGKDTDLRKIKVSLLLKTFEVRGHLFQLRLKREHLLMVPSPCAPSAMSTDGRLASGAPAEAGRVRCTRRPERGESRGGVGWLATPPCNGIVWVSWVISVPESLHPLHKLEIIPGRVMHVKK